MQPTRLPLQKTEDVIRWLRHAIRAEVEPAIRRLAQEPVIQIKGVNIDVCFEGHKKAEAAGLLPRPRAPRPKARGDISIKSSGQAANASLLSRVIHRFFTT